MKAVVLVEKGKLIVEDVPKPPLGRDEVMVRVTDCGICGSDIRYLHGENPWAQHTLGEMRQNPRNIIPGHEVCGIVDEIGEGADESLLGERVAVLSFRVDQTCWWCRHGEEELCPNMQHLGHGAGWGQMDYYYGGMTEYVPVWASHVFPLPDHVLSTDATLLDPLGVAVHAVELAGIKPGEPALVMGTGVIGLLVIQVLKAYGATNIICADLDEMHLSKGAALGADRTINVREEDLARAVLEASGGLGARVIIDTAGRPLDQLLPILTRGGRLIELAVHDRREGYEGLQFAGQRMVMVSANFKYAEWPITMDLLFSGRVNGKPLITHRFPIEQAVEAFRVAENKEETGAVKVVINP